jgi:hypothetical protein
MDTDIAPVFCTTMGLLNFWWQKVAEKSYGLTVVGKNRNSGLLMVSQMLSGT